MTRRVLQTPLGPMTAAAEDGALVLLRFGAQGGPIPGTAEESALLDRLDAQLREYAQGIRRGFSLPLRPAGTAFQRRVWAALQSIPYGARRSYGEIAAALGQPAAARAVGRACARNPIAVLIPCHRVVGRDGALTGYSAGGGTQVKKRLLDLESGYEHTDFW